jgi:ATP-dependent exoDNAse (exonuclease V) beta subunit
MNAALKQTLPPARLLECTPEEYHKDPCSVPSLSASIAHTLVAESPAHAWTRHPKFAAQNDDQSLEPEEDDSKAKDNGALVHRLLLGKGADLVVIDADNFRTKLAREERDAAKAAGKLPILTKRHEELLQVVAHLRGRCAELGYEFTGESEVPVEWHEQGLQGPIVCRSMWDHVFFNEGVIYDLKTIRSAHPENIARYFVDHGYDIQNVAYTRALERLRPELTGRVELTFLFCEIEPPYSVVPAVPDGALVEIGKQRWAYALTLWERCLAKNDWPSYCNSLVTLEAPRYVISKHLGEDWIA